MKCQRLSVGLQSQGRIRKKTPGGERERTLERRNVFYNMRWVLEPYLYKAPWPRSQKGSKLVMEDLSKHGSEKVDIPTFSF